MCASEWMLNTRRKLPHKQLAGSVLFATWRLSFDLPASILKALKEQQTQQNLFSTAAEGATEAYSGIPEDEQNHDPNFQLYDDLIGKYNLREHNLSCEPYLSIIKQVIHHDDNLKYDLYAYCIMPNHVHMVLKPLTVMAHASCAEGSRGDCHYDSASSPSHVLCADGSRGDCHHGTVIAHASCADNANPVQPQAQYHKITKITRDIKSISAHKINQALHRSGNLWMAESYDHIIRTEPELIKTLEYVICNPVKAGLVDEWKHWTGSYLSDQYM